MADGGAIHYLISSTDSGSAAIVDRLVSVIGEASELLDAAVKWRRLTFAREGNFHHWL